MDPDRELRHLQIELAVSSIQKEMAIIRWRNVRSTGSSKARCIVAREYADALKRYKLAETAWEKFVSGEDARGVN